MRRDMARRCCHLIVAPSATSSPAAPKRLAQTCGAAPSAAPWSPSSIPAKTVIADSAMARGHRLGSNSAKPRSCPFPTSTSPLPSPLASGREEFPVSDQGPRQTGSHPLPRRVQQASFGHQPAAPHLAHTMGRPYHALERGKGGARLLRPLCLPHRHHRPTDRPRRRGRRHLPLQGSRRQLPPSRHPPRRGVHAPLSPACPAAGISQAALLWPVASCPAPPVRQPAQRSAP